MWKRLSSRQAVSGDTRFGVGVQVHVIADPSSSAEHWEGEPTGVIVSPASATTDGAPHIHSMRGRAWTVAFDDLQFKQDGRGPFEYADILEVLLVPAPPVPDFD